MKILICGCIYGAGNIGDEAILMGMLKILPNDSTVGVAVVGHKKIYQDLGLLTFDTDIKGIICGIQWADQVILGGASLLTDPMGYHYPLLNCAIILKIASFLKKECRFVGIGATRLNNKESLLVAKSSYTIAKQFFVRNELSKNELLMQISMKEKNVHNFCDTAFFLKNDVCKQYGRDILNISSVGILSGPLIGVSVVNENFANGRKYHIEIAKACDELYYNYNAQIVFVYSEVRKGDKYDYAAAEKVKKFMKAPWKEVRPDFYSSSEFISILANMDAVIAMRMHVIILAALSGIPSVAIVREDKVNQILKDIGLTPCGTIDDIESQKIVSMTLDFLKNKSQVADKMSQNIDKLVTDAKEVFKNNINWSAEKIEKCGSLKVNLAYFLIKLYLLQIKIKIKIYRLFVRTSSTKSIAN